MKPYWILVFLSVLLMGCMERQGLAPVEDRKWQPINSPPAKHRVQKDETLYSVAFRYDMDYQKLARLNHIKYPYSIHIGQVIWLKGSPKYPSKSKVIAFISKKRAVTVKEHWTHFASKFRKSGANSWLWPNKGTIVHAFNPMQGKKGIDIAGKKGDVVYAAKEGVVAYSGAGLSGYGNLIIIKHEGQYLTAYANNYRNRVVEGQSVKAGQIIADMGVIDRKFWGVHFEIRRAGKPVNPGEYLN